MEVEALEGFEHGVGGPANGLYVVGQGRGFHIMVIVGVDEVERGVVVGLSDVGNERGKAQPLVVVVNACAAQGDADAAGVGHFGG